jgi:LuxR family transcriptional regulator, maltose regulon positive regulatory protein
MAASAAQPKIVRRESRIIERPRLIKLLDDTEARTILLLAPAGYGKTTLARQWAKTLNGAIWVTLTSEDRDVAAMAMKFARTGDPDEPARVTMYLKAHSNPQRMSRELAHVVTERLRAKRVQWVVIDDYHEIASDPHAEQFIEVMNQELNCRFLIASRLRPTWATARLAVYGDVGEISRGELAMSREESRRVLGTYPDFEHVVAQAEGWPAVIGLAASARGIPLPGPQLSSSLLHAYFTEELFKTAGEEVQRGLMRLALAPDLAPTTLQEMFGGVAEQLRDDAENLGFVSSETGTNALHPLVRDFLFEKLRDTTDAATMVSDAIAACLRRERWDRAFELILRFERDDLVEPVLSVAYMPLIRCGHTATLAAFATKVKVAPSFPPAVVDLAEADIALADGAFELASRIAQRAVTRLGEGHELASRAETVIAESAYAQARPAEAEAAYKRAYEFARSEPDTVAALRGWALSCVQGEVPVPPWVMERLEVRRGESPLDLVRHTALELTRRHFTTGFADSSSLISEAAAVLHQVDDPRARSAFAYVAAYVTALRTNYRDATRWLEVCDADIAAFDLDFARPHSLWNHAHVALGLRKFGHAERLLQRLEDDISNHPLDYHVVNARILRGRLALETRRSDAAISVLPEIRREIVIPSIHAEYIATRALALAISGRSREAVKAADSASEMTSAIEVRVLNAATKAILSKTTDRSKIARDAWNLAEELDAWDPLVAAIRASQQLADMFAAEETLRPALAALYQRTNDLGLARLGGLRARAVGDPADLLSPRELEVLGLIARGYRNQEIAAALVLSLSTVKVHVRHIFEKLGVRSRSEAVTRLTAVG